MKAQSAIEYLMTYGWMLLVVALVGGLLFALFQDQELESESVEGFEGSDVRVEEVNAGNDSVQLSLSSYSSEDMESVSVCLNNSELGGKCSEDFSLDRLGDRVVDLNGFNESEEIHTYDITVSYKTNGRISDTVSGSVSLGVKPVSSEDDGSGEDSNPSETVSISVRNVGDNVSGGVSPGDYIKIFGEFNSTGSSLDSGWLSTNETGTWENKTSKYFNDSLGGEDVWVWNNFTWSNSSVSSEEVGWRLYANNSDGKVENSPKKNFDVGSGVSAPSVEVLEPVGVNGSNATLRGNVTSLGGASSVNVSFNVTSNSSIGVKDAGSVSSVGIVTDDLIDLEVATAYNFTITADNEEQIALSNRQEFITRENIDGFESGDFDKWSNVPASWEIDSSVAHEGSFSLYKQEGVGPSNSAVYNGDIEPPSQGSRFHWYHRWNGNSNGASFVNFGLKDWNNRYQTFFNPSDNIAIIRKFEDGGFQDLATKSISGTSNNWYKNEIIWYRNNTIVYRIIDNGNLLGKLKTTDNTYTNGKLGLEAHGDVYIDSLGYDVLENK